MALAPASTVAEMLSGVGPPVAIMGTSGNFSRMRLTTSGVRDAAETVEYGCASGQAGRDIRVLVEHGHDQGYVDVLADALYVQVAHRRVHDDAMAPSASASQASWVVRMPWVVPPPTPQNTGRDE